MRDHVIDVVQRDAHRVKHFVQQQRGVRHRRPVDSPGVGEHPGAGLVTLRVAEAQPAVVGHGGETGQLDPCGVRGGPFEEQRRAGVAQRQGRQFLAHDVADVPGRVLAELGDVLAADHQRAFDRSLPDPVVRDGDTGEHSGAGVRQVERHRLLRADRVGDRAAHRGLQPLGQAVVELRDAAADHDIDRRAWLVGLRQTVERRRGGQAVGVLVAHRDAALVDAGQPLEVDVRVMAGSRHQVGCASDASAVGNGPRRPRGCETVRRDHRRGVPSPATAYPSLTHGVPTVWA